ncbi:MAG: CapA family protein [Clostridia bacterium]|nr:CapA family protein [Clostridia bacterium]
MNIHANFTGGNIRVLKIEGTDVYIQNEIRDTMEDWFYWAFCVEGAQGQTLTFHFDKRWLGYYGPAVSHDLYNWKWQNEEAAPAASDTFTYTFDKDESCVWFAHNMLYHPAHFDAFCKELGLEQLTLCKSERGRDVPYVRFGKGDEQIILTARHHACEATGTYVLEGVVRELLREPIPNTEVVVVPFVDYDGVVDGDQGKARAPFDHNRDYRFDETAIYATVRAIQKIAADKPLRYAFDFHSPWHLSGLNDGVFFPQKYSGIKPLSRLSCLLEQLNTPESLPYAVRNTIAPGVGWNVSANGQGRTFGAYMQNKAGAELACTLETPYFTCSGTPFSAARARELGRCFALALREYHFRNVKISFTGDLLYGQKLVNEWCKTKEGYDFLPLLRSSLCRLPDSDYLVGNVESPFAGEQNDGYTHDRYCFNTPDEALEALKKAGFDLLSLANNHAMDRKQEGILATLDACDRAGLEHIGLYRTREESDEVFVREIGGIKVGFVNVTYGTNAFAHHHFLGENEKHMIKMTQPEETLDGSIHLLLDLDEIERQTNALYGDEVNPIAAPYLERLKEEIQRTREKSDFVVMLLHSGGQYNLVPDAYTQMLAEKIWEYGADIIVGNHPHLILPSTFENGRFTAYCLGNLLSSTPGYAMAGLPVNPDFSAVLNLTLEKKEDGRIEKHLSFRIFQIMHDPDRKKAPWVVDTYDQWAKDPYASYKDAILFYANRFMPGMNYREPMAEYPIC